MADTLQRRISETLRIGKDERKAGIEGGGGGGRSEERKGRRSSLYLSF